MTRAWCILVSPGNRKEQEMTTYRVTGALITPHAGDNTHPFEEVVEAASHEAAFAQVHAGLSARLDPEGTGEGDVWNFYVDTTGDRWYGWQPAEEDDLGWGNR
jgi:hypothetical protein